MSKITPITYAIHSDDESPIFGAQTITVSADDEGGGMFLRIKGDLLGEKRCDKGELVIDLADLAQVVTVADMLRVAHGSK